MPAAESQRNEQPAGSFNWEKTKVANDFLPAQNQIKVQKDVHLQQFSPLSSDIY